MDGFKLRYFILMILFFGCNKRDINIHVVSSKVISGKELGKDNPGKWSAVEKGDKRPLRLLVLAIISELV